MPSSKKHRELTVGRVMAWAVIASVSAWISGGVVAIHAFLWVYGSIIFD